jgi:hypothetical protein
LGHAERVNRPGRNAVHAASTGALLAGALVGVAACGQNSGCVHTALDVRPVHVTGQKAPLTLRATLTSDGAPLARFRLAFSLVFTGPTALVGKSGKTGDLVGYSMTNANGVATYRIPGGAAAVALPGEHAVGYSVSLTSANPINGKQYCDVHESASFT